MNGLLRAAMAGTMLFFVSAFFAIGEVSYFLWGKTTTAHVSNVQTIADNHDRPIEQSVKYSFQDDDGKRRTERNRVALEWQPPADGNLKIDYVPGTEGKSRVAGNRNTVMLKVFFGSLMFTVIMFCGAWAWDYRKGDPWKGIQGG